MANLSKIYTNTNLSVTWDNIARAEAYGAKAIVWTIDAPADSVRHRAARYDTTNAYITSLFTKLFFSFYTNSCPGTP